MDPEEIQCALETRDEEMAGWFTNSWRRVSPRWEVDPPSNHPRYGNRWNIPWGWASTRLSPGPVRTAPDTGATYAAAGALMLIGAPAYTFLTERKIERKMAKLRTTQEGR